MNEQEMPNDAEVINFIERLEKEARQGGYDLNQNKEFTRGLAKGLLINERRYGYLSCPCRLAVNEREKDLDIICPCYYRDPDLAEYGACYCALYVSRDIARGQKELSPVPERRIPFEKRTKLDLTGADISGSIKLSVPVWRCLVCGYLCGRDTPPELCPICKASKDRFERFL
ncbi:MAG: ferredoxin:glutaredoxin reductase [Methanotrichaceae archaeon]|nr:ferredoxin:glutaredoxin reductase [Methanotrichaceae archaeon]